MRIAVCAPQVPFARGGAEIFADDLASDGVASGLYIPLKDDEGVVGILVLESAKTDFAMNVDSLHADAALPRLRVAPNHAALGGVIQVGVIMHDNPRVAA